MQDLKERIDQISQTYETFRDGFDLGAKKERLAELTAKSADPDIWNDPVAAKKLLQETAWLKEDVEEVESLDGEIKTVSELASLGEVDEDFGPTVLQLEKRIAQLKTKLLLSGPMDAKNAIVSIHAGQGGTEAMDWANMLYRMYIRFSGSAGSCAPGG